MRVLGGSLLFLYTTCSVSGRFLMHVQSLGGGLNKECPCGFIKVKLIWALRVLIIVWFSMNQIVFLFTLIHALLQACTASRLKLLNLYKKRPMGNHGPPTKAKKSLNTC